MNKVVLIAGATGSVGSVVVPAFVELGYEVRILSRRILEIPGTQSFVWNPQLGEIDAEAVRGVDSIVNLAGEGIAQKRWTAARKKTIQESRTQALDVLWDACSKIGAWPKSLISASAIGAYGGKTRSTTPFVETDEPANDFMGQTCQLWEAAALRFETKGVRTVCLRIAVVLSANGGALPRIAAPVRMGLGAALGSGNQPLPWIHIDDLVQMILHSAEKNTVRGVYNAVAPAHDTLRSLTVAIAFTVQKPLWLPNVPSFLLRGALGEMSVVVLGGNWADPQKIIDTGFMFEHLVLRDAVVDLLT